MTIQPVKLGTNPNNKKQAVFIAITVETDVWKNYEGISEDAKKTIVPLVLMIDRWDGLRGFVGGEVEECEDLFTAALREFKEEVGYKLTDENILSKDFVSSHETKKNVTHLINIKVTEETFVDIISNFKNAEHYLSEISGVTAHHFINYPHKCAFDNFIKGVFAPTVKEEIADLILFNDWNNKYNLPIDFVPKEVTQLSLVNKHTNKM